MSIGHLLSLESLQSEEVAQETFGIGDCSMETAEHHPS